MDGFQAPTALIAAVPGESDGFGAGRRDLFLDTVGDCLDMGRPTPDEAERAVERLIAVALSEESRPVRESALHAVCLASTHHELPYRLVEPLAACADALDPPLLGHALAILGSTHDRSALPVVERFLRHCHSGVRAEAADELRQSRQPGREDGRTAGDTDMRRLD
ncbi:hypothetical protein [Streptomyces sp. RFCAC02]|uniref:hypothetical protein n=1 Tax=Streptomyces sp. RFCAC02 TaxID=2499143 RepID=UPI0010209A42|nr:hypothetical protein [Streptomyces sp. RFCAC02]